MIKTLHQILKIPLSEVPVGIEFYEIDRYIVYRSPDGDFLATRNKCQHQQGFFQRNPDNKKCLICPRHGWQLDMSTLTYVNPVGTIKQEGLITNVVREDDVDYLIISEEAQSPHWGQKPRRQEIQAGELTIEFYAHACAAIKMRDKTLFTDPWLTGPALIRGWWLTHRPPLDWLERLAEADAIYISHNHPDHLHPHTLKKLAEVNPDIPIYIPAFENDSCLRLIHRTGLKNVSTIPFDTWQPFGEGRFMLLKDTSGRDDSGILLDYKGYQILNSVDCCNINNGFIPEHIDVLMAAFSGGASGFPVCWGELYPQSEITALLEKLVTQEMDYVLDLIKKTKPSIVMPFAGYFTEALPSDADIRKLNIKNSPQKLAEAIRQNYPQITTWIPTPGYTLDAGLSLQSEDSYVECPADASNLHSDGDIARYTDEDFEPYLKEIRQDYHFKPLQSLAGLQHYFDWANFKGDVVLHVLETSEDFQETIREFYVDFRNGLVSTFAPENIQHYERMKVRADSFRHALRYGLSWEDISSGFQAKFYREPNVYRFDFWNHFQNKLDPETLKWD